MKLIWPHTRTHRRPEVKPAESQTCRFAGILNIWKMTFKQWTSSEIFSSANEVAQKEDRAHTSEETRTVTESAEGRNSCTFTCTVTEKETGQLDHLYIDMKITYWVLNSFQSI